MASKVEPKKAKPTRRVLNAAQPAEKTSRRKIPGALPYTSASGVLKRVLDKIPTSEKPSIFNADFLATVMGTTGGSSRPIIPILKATGLLNQSGTPTELYSQFQTESGRPAAAFHALKNGFSEVFKRNVYAHRADEKTLIDIIVAITGLPKTEPIVKYMLNTFEVFQETAKQHRDQQNNVEQEPKKATSSEEAQPGGLMEFPRKDLSLVYNINVVLPETTNVEVYNAIFRSLKGNLLN